MINLQDDIYLDADRYQFILTQKRVVKEGDNEGKEYFHALGYYPTIATLLHALAEKRIRDSVARGASLKAICDELSDWAKGLKTPLVGDLKDAIGAWEGK